MAGITWIPQLAWRLACRFPNATLVALGTILLAVAMGKV